MKITEIKKEARNALEGKRNKGALIMLAYVVIMLIITIIENTFKETMISKSISIAKTIITVPLSFGITFSFIRLKRGEDVKAFDFLYSGFSNFGRAWKISLRVTLKMLLPIILICIIAFVMIVMIIQDSIQLLEVNVIYKLNYMILIEFIACIILYIYIITRVFLYSLTTYIAFDNPDMTALEVVNESAKVMKGNRIKLFLLLLSFIGWAILCLFTLGIGYLWLIPYVQVTGVCFYEKLFTKSEEDVIIEFE